MPLLTARESSHWYLKDGTPFYEVPNKSKGGMRPARIDDARAARAVPSVTTILSILRKPSLENWKIEKGIMAALTLPKLPEEGLDSFADRVIRDMEEQSEKARELGGQVHEACAIYADMSRSNVLTLIGPTDSTLATLTRPFRDWFDAHVTKVHAVEKVFVGDGYAGRCDLIADVDGYPAICDLKTQAVKNGKPVYYLDWPIQLCAYRKSYVDSKWQLAKAPDSFPKLLSIVIDTNPDSLQPGARSLHQWPEGTFDEDVYYETFQAAFRLWKFMNSW